MSTPADFPFYRTGALVLKQVQSSSSSDGTRAQPTIIAVLHCGPQRLLETEVHLRISPSVADPVHRVSISHVDVGSVGGATWEEAFKALADRLHRAAASLEAAAAGSHISLPITSIHPDLAKKTANTLPENEEPS